MTNWLEERIREADAERERIIGPRPKVGCRWPLEDCHCQPPYDGCAYRARQQAGQEPMPLREVAEQLGMTPGSVRVQVNRGVLKARKLGPLWIVDQEEVERYAREHRRVKA